MSHKLTIAGTLSIVPNEDDPVSFQTSGTFSVVRTAVKRTPSVNIVLSGASNVPIDFGDVDKASFVALFSSVPGVTASVSYDGGPADQEVPVGAMLVLDAQGGKSITGIKLSGTGEVQYFITK